MATASKPLKLYPGDVWEVPDQSVVTTPSGDVHTVTGGAYVVQETGTYANDTGDRATVEPRPQAKE